MINAQVEVMIHCDPALPLCAYYVQLGLEEEGVPSQVVYHEIRHSYEQAKIAAEISRLQVGVAVCATDIVIHHQKLAQTQPILSYTQSEKNARLAGKNAARLVKGLPFDLGEEQ